MPLRRLASILIAALCVTAAASAATRSGPGLVHRGQLATFSAAVPYKSKCRGTIHYANGALQEGALKLARTQRLTWSMRVPVAAPLGVAHWQVLCTPSVKRSGSFVVVDVVSTTGAASQVPKVVVDKQGFSQRPDRFGTGSSLSYGLLLHNTSPMEDAENVYVIVNFVAADGTLLGSKTQTVDVVPAGGTYALGNSMPLRTQVSTTRLEVTVRVGAHEPKQARSQPYLANVRILPAQNDPGWVGEVDGEVVNDTSPLTLSRASMSIVITDAGGNIVGGGTTSLFSPLPSGSRIVFLSRSGYNSIPLDQAAGTIISIDPTYTNPNS